jgi:hypothetical protein
MRDDRYLISNKTLSAVFKSILLHSCVYQEAYLSSFDVVFSWQRMYWLKNDDSLDLKARTAYENGDFSDCISMCNQGFQAHNSNNVHYYHLRGRADFESRREWTMH